MKLTYDHSRVRIAKSSVVPANQEFIPVVCPHCGEEGSLEEVFDTNDTAELETDQVCQECGKDFKVHLRKLPKGKLKVDTTK